jgi:2-keto-4-pentenoate hydratase/2-oxohepta-3-ene-1,7-dioic acid hydratase in catechol pathway
VLQEIVAFLDKEGAKPGAAAVTSLTALPPVGRPGKMFYAAQNFQEHVDEMIRAGMTPATGPKFTGEKSTTKPYLFLKAPSCLAGANDDIEIPRGLKKIDWRPRSPAPSAGAASTSRPPARSTMSPAS